MEYETIIGLEVHVQLDTRSKLFCGCSTRFNPDQPNTQTCPVCLGLPGALPVMNRRAIELGSVVGLALNCRLAEFTKWDRKQYFYPDLPKAYQISQYDLPLAFQGHFDVAIDPKNEDHRRVRITRAHLEEDAGKNIHDPQGLSKVDLNRCGTPLLEIVSEPDIRSPLEARRYLEELRLLLTYLDVSDCNMQEGSLRCDANVNVRITLDDGRGIATPIVEVKNLNSFRGVEAACEFEVARQIREFEERGEEYASPHANKSTRGWDAERNRTFPQREKEEAADYRYFPDPDLLPVVLAEEERQAIADRLCEFPADRRSRLRSSWQLSAYDASVIIDQGRMFAEWYESIAQTCGDGKLAANWATQDVLREMNERGIETPQDFPIPEEVLAQILTRVKSKQLTTAGARELFTALLAKVDADQPATIDRMEELIRSLGLTVVSDDTALLPAIAEVLSRNEKLVTDIREGKLQAVGPMIGQVMGQVKGADARRVRELLLEQIGE